MLMFKVELLEMVLGLGLRFKYCADPQGTRDLGYNFFGYTCIRQFSA